MFGHADQTIRHRLIEAARAVHRDDRDDYWALSESLE
jgi:hypothetical protein